MRKTLRSSNHPGTPAGAWLDAYRRLAPAWRLFWPGALDGIENLPAGCRYLLVANHSGLGVAECVTLLGAWTDRFGPSQPLAAMAHPSLFLTPLANALRGFGVVEATREGAELACEHGSPLLLFPGGEEESMRPLWAARRVDFRGRKGWIRLARRHGLEIVPLAITGSHVTIPNLGYAKAPTWMTQLFGVRSAPLPVLGMLAAWGAAAFVKGSSARRATAAIAAFSATALIPWVPSRIGFHVLEPIRDVGQTEEEIYGQVVLAIERELQRAPLRGSIWA